MSSLEEKIGHHHNFIPLGHGCSSCGKGTKELLEILAKQRTQLLARVREAVGKDEPEEEFNVDADYSSTTRNELRKEILKKLETISEE